MAIKTITRPEISLERWGPIPDDHPVELRVGQAGFYLVNDGITAYDLSMETVKIGPSMQVSSGTLARIGEKEQGFLLVWLDGFSPNDDTGEKWDLASAMANAARQDPRTAWDWEYTIRISLTYRDSRSCWYRSSADLFYIQSQMRLEFRSTSIDLVEPESETNDLSSPRTAPGSGKTAAQPPNPEGSIREQRVAKGAMNDILAELFATFSPDEQARIRSAEAAAKGIIAQGDNGVRERLQRAGLLGDRDWILEPQNEVRGAAAYSEFFAYHKVLWLRTDSTSPESIREFLTQLDKLCAGLREQYGSWECGHGIADLRAEAERLAWLAHGEHLASLKGQPVAPNKLPSHSEQSVTGRGARPDPGALFAGREFPRFMYHHTKEPRTISSRQEEAALGPEWSRVYIHQDYPKVKYHWSKPEVTVKNADEEKALGVGWADRAAFAPYKGARPARTDDQDPAKWLDEWSVPSLSPEHRKKIKAHLLRADGAFERSPDPDSAAIASMRQAFDGIAQVLFDAGILAEGLLGEDIPRLVWDAAIAGGWWRLASETRQDIFPEQIGHYWVWREEGGDWRTPFRAEAREWRANLLERPAMAQGAWKDLRGEFQTSASQYADRAERESVEWAQIPPGRWALCGGSPRSERIFKGIAAKAAAKAGKSKGEESEAWQAWVDFMWTEGWRRPDSRNSSLITRRPQRITAQQSRQMGMEDLEIQRIESVFQTSADCCQECEDREMAAEAGLPRPAELAQAGPDQTLELHEASSNEGSHSLRPRVRRKDDQLETTRQLVKQMRQEGYSHKEMCKRLGDHPRPIHAAWRNLTWPVAFLQHNSSVKKWLSAASK
jgi:hypothetical protein